MSRRREQERDYFVSTCLKVGSVASWVFFSAPLHPPYLHSLFRDTPGRVCVGCLFRRPAKDFSSACWLCHLGGTGRPARSQDLTGPPRSVLILRSPPRPPLRGCPATSGRGERGCPLGGLHLQNEGFRRRSPPGGTDGKAGGTDMGTCDFSRRVWIPQGPLMKLARRGLAPGLGR